jgi:WD40 repeat protein
VFSFGGPDGGWDYPIRVANVCGLSDVRQFDTEADTHISDVAFSTTNRFLAAGGYGIEFEGEVYVWDLQTSQLAARFSPKWGVTAVAFSPDELRLATGTMRGELIFWDLQTKRQWTIRAHNDWIKAVAFSPDGRLVASTSHDGTCRIYDFTEESLALDREFIDHPDHVAELVFSRSGARFVTRSENGTLHLWDGNTGKPIACLHADKGFVLDGGDPRCSLYLSDEVVVSLARDASGVWDVSTGRLICAQAHSDRGLTLGQSVTFSPDGGSFCVVKRKESQVHIYDTFGGKLLARLDHSGSVGCAAYSADSRFLAAGTEDGKIRIWDVPEGRQVGQAQSHKSAVAGCAFSSDGRRLATVAADGTLYVWQIGELGQKAASWQREKLRGAPSLLQSLLRRRANSPADLRLAAPRIILDPTDDLELGDAGDRDARYSELAFLKPDRFVVVRAATGKFTIWDWLAGVLVRKIDTTQSIHDIVLERATHARRAGDEVVISDSASGKVIGWFPVPTGLSPIWLVPHPRADIWAGAFSRTIYHFKLER